MKHSQIIAIVLALVGLFVFSSGCTLDLHDTPHVLRTAVIGSGTPSGESNATSGESGVPSGNPSDDPAPSSAVTIEETVLFNQSGIIITAKSFDAKGSIFGPQIKLLVENNSEQSITVQARNTSVNGYMINEILSTKVTPGKKANDTLTLSSSDLKAAGITTIATVEFYFHIYDSDTMDTILDSDYVRIETSAAEGFTYTYDNSGAPAYNANGVEIVIKGLDENGSSLGQTVLVYIYNYSNRTITVQTRNVSVNDYMITGIFSCTVAPGKHAVDDITFLSSSLEENGIQTIETIELSFHIYAQDSWSTIVDTELIRVDFN